MKVLRRLATAAPLLSLMAGGAAAQLPNDQFVGTWTLAEVYDDYGNGKISNPWGPDVKGQLTYTPNGRFSLMIIAAGRPSSAGLPTNPVGPALGYFGTYTVRGSLIVHQTERSTFPNWEGHERLLTSLVSGNTLQQTAPAIADPSGQSFVPHLNWMRQ
jgi:hypothetical protein